MPSIRALYNDELVQAQRAAVAMLHKLMTEGDDPLESRRIAVALLRTRQVNDGEATPTPSTPRKHARSEAPKPEAEQIPEPASPTANDAPQPAAQDPSAANLNEEAAAPHTPTPPAKPSTPSPAFTPDASRNCTHPALPPYPGMYFKELVKKARQT